MNTPCANPPCEPCINGGSDVPEGCGLPRHMHAGQRHRFSSAKPCAAHAPKPAPAGGAEDACDLCHGKRWLYYRGSDGKVYKATCVKCNPVSPEDAAEYERRVAHRRHGIISGGQDDPPRPAEPAPKRLNDAELRERAKAIAAELKWLIQDNPAEFRRAVKEAERQFNKHRAAQPAPANAEAHTDGLTTGMRIGYANAISQAVAAMEALIESMELEGSGTWEEAVARVRAAAEKLKGGSHDNA